MIVWWFWRKKTEKIGEERIISWLYRMHWLFYLRNLPICLFPELLQWDVCQHKKDLNRLIAIWAEIEPYFPDWKLTIIGSGELQDTLERQIGLLKLKSVEICPPRAEIIREYLGSSVYVLTSRHEGFPMVLHEAMACGLPVVAYTCKCGPGILFRTGRMVSW